LIIPLHNEVAVKARHLAAAAAVAVLRTPVLGVQATVKAGVTAKVTPRVDRLAPPRQQVPPPEAATSPTWVAQVGLLEAWLARLLAAQAAMEAM
jgi:hypothetical protein